MDVVIADLGLGNLRSVARAFERNGAVATVSRDADVIAKASRLVVPGQGAYQDCAAAMGTALGEAVRSSIAGGAPYLGICLGMQVLFDGSEEAPGAKGLGVIPGMVVKFAPTDGVAGESRRKVPHMGWNEVTGSHAFLPASGWFYFVHSYYCVPTDPAFIAATTDYGQAFCSAVAKDNLFACQFHPEKSQDEGDALIGRFLAA